MAVEKLITTAGQALIAQALAGTDDLDGMTVVLGSGRSSPAVGNAGVETALSPAVSYDADYAAVTADGKFQVGVADTTVNDADGAGGTSFTASEFAVMKGTTCVARVVETDSSEEYSKPGNASWSANFTFDADNPTTGTVEVDISHFDGLAARGIAGRVPINTETQFAERASGIHVPLTSEIPAPASAEDIAARTGKGYVEAEDLPPVPQASIVNLLASQVTGTNALILAPTVAPASVGFGLSYRIVAPRTSTNNVTVSVRDADGVAHTAQLWIDGVQAGSGDIVAGKIYDIFHDGTRWHVVGGNTEFLTHSHFTAPVAISPSGVGNTQLAWNVGVAPIARAQLLGDTSINAFTGGVDGGFYELIVIAPALSGASIVLSSSYKRGNTPRPGQLSSGSRSYLLFQQDGTTRVFLGERTGYRL